MDAIGRGIIAGFLATLLLSAMFHPMAFLARMADLLPPTFGWLLHFVVGSLIWGAAFSVVERFLRGPSWVRGVLFGFGAWLIVMLAVMPLTRGGLFGLKLGVAAPAAMLTVHVVYGALLGAIYGVLDPRAEPRPHDGDHADENLHPLPR